MEVISQSDFILLAFDGKIDQIGAVVAMGVVSAFDKAVDHEAEVFAGLV
jgi:hypothetical protein